MKKCIKKGLCFVLAFVLIFTLTFSAAKPEDTHAASAASQTCMHTMWQLSTPLWWGYRIVDYCPKCGMVFGEHLSPWASVFPALDLSVFQTGNGIPVGTTKYHGN